MSKLRNSRLAAIHMGKKQLGLDEDTYRDMLEQVGGSRSAKDLDNDGLVKVLKNWSLLVLVKIALLKKSLDKNPM